MKTNPAILARSIPRPLLALLFSSALGTALLIVRIVVTHRMQHAYLFGNLILAWIPLLASMLLDQWEGNGSVAHWKRGAAYAVWFFFFPNAPYILTDLVHLGPKYYGRFWIDLLLILLFAITGLVLAFLSLRSMQQRVQRRLNWFAGWLFVAAMSLLCGIGIYAGRFLRWNSWDVIARPWLIVNDLAEWLLTWFYRPLSIAFPLLFAIFLFTVYLTLVAISTGEVIRKDSGQAGESSAA